MRHYNYTLPGGAMIEGTMHFRTKDEAKVAEALALKMWRAQGKSVPSMNSRTEWFSAGDIDVKELVHFMLSDGPPSIKLTGLCSPSVKVVKPIRTNLHGFVT